MKEGENGREGRRDGGTEGRREGGKEEGGVGVRCPRAITLTLQAQKRFTRRFVFRIYFRPVECEKRYWAAPKTERTGAITLRSPLRRENMQSMIGVEPCVLAPFCHVF